MDQDIRNRLRNVVTQCRKLLEDSISRELEGKYGIFAKKDQVAADPNAKMSHLAEEEQAARKDILDHFAHIKARGFKPKEALDQLVREIAFTHLNRFCAYKMMEAREVYVGGQKFREAVSRGVNSNGVKFYLADHPDDLRLFETGHQDIAYRHFLDWLGGALSDEIGVLFNPNDPANRLYPRQKTLVDVLELLNHGGIRAEETELREQWPKIWSQDETIGWVYQYFTPKELRDQARKESQAPRNSYELAFRNQFFTPRYVVEFLTDNTLGRTWYEMRKGDTKLKDQCRYMVRRPTEIFLDDGERPPKDAADGRNDLSQEELLKLPVHIPHRAKKGPRELKILDPACGSGHFLLYCFDLLLTIYEEAYADSDLGPALRKDYPKLEDLRRDVPRLILAHNLHGIDIDLRASQIAALALWLRCQRAYQEVGLKKDRPEINRSNFVCAEPMPGEEHMLKEFVGQLKPRLLGQLVEAVFDKMKLAGEAGSLLKIEEEIAEAVAEARRQWRIGPVATQMSLFGELKPVERQERFDLSGINDTLFFEEAEAKVVDALRTYAEKARNEHRLQRRLFAADAVRGFAFLDLCHERFEVVLMNPPFGSPSLIAETYLHRAYPTARYEAYGQFLVRAHAWATGFVGALTSRGYLFLANYQSVREATVPYFTTFLDLGAGVLDDAFVEVCATVMSKTPCETVLCIDNRRAAGLPIRREGLASLPRPSLFLKAHIQSLDQSPFCYDTDPNILALFRSGYTFDKAVGGIARVGLATGDNERFIRCHWEVPPDLIRRRWQFHGKGGEYLPFRPDVHLVVDWSDDGREIEGAFVGARIHKTDVYFRPAVTYSRRSLKGLSFRALPADCICGEKGPVLISEGNEYALLALANSCIFKYLIVIQSAASSFEIGAIQRVPFPMPFERFRERLSELGREISSLYAETSCFDETDIRFYWPSFWLGSKSILELEAQSEAWLNASRDRAGELLRDLDAMVLSAYRLDSLAIPSNDYVSMLEVFAVDQYRKKASGQLVSLLLGCVFGRWDVRFVDGSRNVRIADVFESLAESSPIAIKYRSNDRTSVSAESYPLRINWDGILVDDADHTDDIIHRIRDVFELIWNDRAEAIEKEACEILGVSELRDYFRKTGAGGFWDDHIKRYSKSRRKAPIYWLLQSSKKNYAIWIYYHRLDKDLLFKALVNYVEPRIRLEERRFGTLRTQKSADGDSSKETKRRAKEAERQEDFISELRDFEDKLRRAANLHLDPDLNDGVILNIAPLHELAPWKEAKKYWDELLEGKYRWSSIGKQLREKGLVR
jgi:hypothetical protein